jgi:hypothetical protein
MTFPLSQSFSQPALPLAVLPPNTTPASNGVLPKALSVLHRQRGSSSPEANKPFPLDTTLLNAGVIGATVGGVVAASYTTHGAFFEKMTVGVPAKAIAQLHPVEKALAIVGGLVMGSVIGGVVVPLGTAMWKAIIEQWYPPKSSKK